MRNTCSTFALTFDLVVFFRFASSSTLFLNFVLRQGSNQPQVPPKPNQITPSSMQDRRHQNQTLRRRSLVVTSANPSSPSFRRTGGPDLTQIKFGCPIFATVPSSLRWVIRAEARTVFLHSQPF